MGALSLAFLLSLAAANAPEVASSTIAAFTEAESGGNPLSIHDNTASRTYSPASRNEAIAITRDLLRQGHSLDLGLLQINDANLRHTGLTVATAFDPAESVRAGAEVMVAAYQQCLPGRTVQAALRCMASVYNTGREQAGLMNGYVARVWRVAEQLVPAIASAGVPAIPPPPVDPANTEPPAWDIWSHADWEMTHGIAPAVPVAPPPSDREVEANPAVTLHRLNPENGK